MGMEAAQGNDFSVTPTQRGLVKDMDFLPRPPVFWACRKEPLSLGETKTFQCKLFVAAVSRPDTRARFARIPPRINSL